MEKKKIDALFEEGRFEELVGFLEAEVAEDYEEYTMLKLAQAYLIVGDEKKSKKLVRRLKMLFPNGTYYKEEDELLEAITSGETDKYIARFQKSQLIKPVSENMDTEKVNLPAKMKKEAEIPENIKEYFKEVVGLTSVQSQLDAFYKLIHLQNQRKQMEFKVNLLKSTHFVISGKRGCGKTLVGEIIAKMLADFSLRKDADPTYMEADELLRAYEEDRVGGIANIFKKASNRTVIVENIEDVLEDHSLNDACIRGIISCLEKILKERKDDLSIIITGTFQSVEHIRIVERDIEDYIQAFVDIPEYATDELLQIMNHLAKKKALRIHESCEKVLRRKIDMERKSPEFMNAISLNRYIDQAAGKMAMRLYEMSNVTEGDLVYLMPQDFELEFEEDNLEEVVAQLEALTGLHSVKQQIRTRIQTVSANLDAARAGAARKSDNGTLHMLFTGNPGTGKTTVARMVGKIYQQLGILPKGNHMVECTRSQLVGQYQGHTAKLVEQKFKEAAGGVLFIDEAYALCRDKHDTFGQEAVDEIIAQMENNKDSMMVILAGYKKEMEEFLQTNSGFKSRIRNCIEFEDYSIDEMVEIFKYMTKQKNMQLNYDTKEALLQLLEVGSKQNGFGNARGVRNLFEAVVEALNRRLNEKKNSGVSIMQNEYDIICKEDIEVVMNHTQENMKR